MVLSGPGATFALGFSPRAAASFGGSAERIVVSLAWHGRDESSWIRSRDEGYFGY